MLSGCTKRSIVLQMMIQPKPRDGMLRALYPNSPDFEGEFVQDDPPNEEGLFEPDDYFKYLNEGPQRIRQMLAETEDPKQKEDLRKALSRWGESEERRFVVGEPYRGEPKEAIQVSSLRELVGKPVEHIMVGDLSGRGVLPEGEVADPDSLNWLGIIDFDFLMNSAAVD